MLDSFRNASKSWIIKLLFGLLALSFVAWGVGDVVNGSLFGSGPAIKVGKVEYSADAVLREFKREIDQLQPQFGGKLTQSDARKLGLLDRTIDTLVNRALIDQAAAQLGLAVSTESVAAQIAAQPAFRNELGQFDPNLLRSALLRAGISEDEFLRDERSNTVRRQMAESLSGGVSAPMTLVDPLVRRARETRVAEAVTVKASAQPVPAAPPAVVLEDFYKANSADFMAPEYRAVTALLVRAKDAAKGIEITDAQVAEAFDARADEFNTPESRNVEQAVLSDQQSADKAAELIKAGKDLKAVAAEFNVSVVDLGAVEAGDLPDELAAQVFAGKSGHLIGPVQSPLGWHVVRIGAITPAQTKTLEQVKDVLAKDLAREKAVDRMSELANQVEDSLGGGATLEETAAKFSLPLLKIAAIDAQGLGPDGKPVATAPKEDSFLDVAFHTEQGMDSQLTELDSDQLFLLRVDGVTPPAPKPLADVRADVLAAWQSEQRHQAAQAKAEALLKKVQDGESLSKVAQAAGLKTETTQPFTRDGAQTVKLPGEVVADLFDGKLGAASAAQARDGWTVAQSVKIIPFDPAADSKTVEQVRNRLSQALAGDLIDQYVSALNADLGVDVDRSQLSREE